MVRNTISCTVAVSAIIGFAGFAATFAGDPDPKKEPECTNTETPQICKDSWCHSVIVGCLAFIHPPEDHFPIPQEDIDELNSCLQDTYDTLRTCLSRICKDKYVVTQEYPTYEQCANQWAADKANCNRDASFCGISYSSQHPDLMPVLRAACREFADEKYKACYDAGKPSYNPSPGRGEGEGDIQPNRDGSGPQLLDGLIGDETFTARNFSPAEGDNSANAIWVPVPGIGESVHSMQLILVEPSYQKAGIQYSDPILPDQDGIYTIQFGDETLDNYGGVDHVSVMIVWRDSENQIIWGEPMEFDIVDTDVAGDFNRDGLRNALDVIAFLEAYDAYAPRADFNRDMVISEVDLALFLSEFNSG